MFVCGSYSPFFLLNFFFFFCLFTCFPQFMVTFWGTECSNILFRTKKFYFWHVTYFYCLLDKILFEIGNSICKIHNLDVLLFTLLRSKRRKIRSYISSKRNYKIYINLYIVDIICVKSLSWKWIFLSDCVISGIYMARVAQFQWQGCWQDPVKVERRMHGRT